jgi:hypothetical protein
MVNFDLWIHDRILAIDRTGLPVTGIMTFTPLHLSVYTYLYRSLLLPPNSLLLLLRAGSPSLFIEARRLPFPYCCVHARPPSLLAQHLPYCCTLYPIVEFSLVFYLTLSLRLKDSVYRCLALALGAQPLDSNAIYLVYIKRNWLCHLWDERGQAKLTQEQGTQQSVKEGFCFQQ